MRLEGRRQSSNVEDRRGMGPVARGGVGIGCGGLLILLIVTLLGGDPFALLPFVATESASVPAPTDVPRGPVTDELGGFASAVLADTEDTWGRLFAESGLRYEEPPLVLFEGSVASACGITGSAVGPFYCPRDRKVYLDLAFFDELSRRFRAPGDFAQAYVIAHEVGHHVQNLLGISDEVSMAQRRSGQARANELSVRLELQADCYAGVWGHYAAKKGLLEPGDLEEALRAAAAIGDDNIQRQAQGYVVPESFTHGSSEQRVEWLRHGLETGDADACQTFRR